MSNPPELPSLPAGNSRLQQAIDMISTLITLSYTINVFTVKWHSIRNRLEELVSGLTAIDKHDPGDDMLLSSEVIQAILDTLSECDVLGKRCIESTYSGKLFMQSDLTKLVCKIDMHIECLSDIYAVGMCIVVKRPEGLASEDDMKIYVNGLLSRLKIGDDYLKKEALVDFNETIREDVKYVHVCVKTDGIVSVLVNFLDYEVIDVQEESAKAVCLICKYDVYRGVLAGAGIIPPLIRVLVCGSTVAQECAARCLMNITEESNYAWSVLAHDGLTVLLEIGKNIDACGSELVVLACEVLKNLSREGEINKFMVEQGALEVFIMLVKSSDEVVLLTSIDCLQIMASMDESNRDLIVKEGGIFVLVDVLDPKSFISSKVGEKALEAIMTLCLKSTSTLNILLDYGFMDHMLHFLQHRFYRVQDLALKAIVWLCETSEEAKNAMGNAGFMPELIKFLDATPIEVRELAAKAISSMISVPKNRRRFIELLDQEEDNSGDRKLLLSILMSLISSTSGRKRIVNSGILHNIKKHAEDEVSDKQKLVRKSASSKFSSIFSGMWH